MRCCEPSSRSDAVERSESTLSSRRHRPSTALSEDYGSVVYEGEGDPAIHSSRQSRTTAKIRETQSRLKDVVSELGQKREMLHDAANEVCPLKRNRVCLRVHAHVHVHAFTLCTIHAATAPLMPFPVIFCTHSLPSSAVLLVEHSRRPGSRCEHGEGGSGGRPRVSQRPAAHFEAGGAGTAAFEGHCREQDSPDGQAAAE